MKKTYYLVPTISTEHRINFMNQKIKLSWADGMVGVMPVFTNKRKAEKYAGKELKHEIVVFEKEEK